MVSKRLLEAMRNMKRGETSKPLSVGLFEPIQRSLKTTNLVRIVNGETCRKLHIYLLIELSMKKGIIYIVIIKLLSDVAGCTRLSTMLMAPLNNINHA